MIGDEEFNAVVRTYMVAFDDDAPIRVVEEHWQSSDGWKTESGQEIIAYCEGTYRVFRSFDALMTALDENQRPDKLEVAINVTDTPAIVAVYRDTEPVFGTITDVINRGHSPGFTFTDHATGATSSVEFSQVRAIMETEAE